MPTRDLQSLFQDIQSRYFPRWDTSGLWKAEYGTPEQLRNNTGYCDTAIRMLYFDRRAVCGMSDEGVRAFIIHEICHATGAAFHNRAWSRRMESAAKRAQSKGEAEVAEILRSDVESYAGEGVLLEYDLSNVQEFAAELYWTHGIEDLDLAIKRTSRYFGHAAAKVRRDFADAISEALQGR